MGFLAEHDGVRHADRHAVWRRRASAAPYETPDELSGDPESAARITDAWAPEPTTWDTPWPEQSAVGATPDADPEAFDLHEDDGWTAQSTDTIDAATPAEAFDPRFATAVPFEAVPGPWAHEPDPEATSTGFYIDWGDPEADAPAAIEQGSMSWDPLTLRPLGEAAVEAEPEVDDELVAEVAAEPEPSVDEPEPEPEDVADTDDELPLISWHPQFDDSPAATNGAATFAVEGAPAPEPEPEPEEQFVVAGAEWVLGNAVPLVEVRSTGSLVMRRADERWALADVTAESDFALEAYVDLRSGPGFGLLFSRRDRRRRPHVGLLVRRGSCVRGRELPGARVACRPRAVEPHRTRPCVGPRDDAAGSSPYASPSTMIGSWRR